MWSPELQNLLQTELGTAHVLQTIQSCLKREPTASPAAVRAAGTEQGPGQSHGLDAPTIAPTATAVGPEEARRRSMPQKQAQGAPQVRQQGKRRLQVQLVAQQATEHPWMVGLHLQFSRGGKAGRGVWEAGGGAAAEKQVQISNRGQ